MSDTAAMRKVLISPADLFIVMSYFLTTGIIAFIKPPMINKEEKAIVMMNDHLRKRIILSPLIIPGILNISKRISDIRKNRKPYNMKASQKPPRILRISEITEECFDSRILATINITASKKKVTE
jgi:hypothetical protein